MISKMKGEGNCKWRSLMGVAAIGVFAFSVSLYGGERLSRVTKDVVPQDNVVAKQTLVGYEIIHSLEALPPQMADRAQPLPLNVPIPIWEVHQDGSPVLDGRVADCDLDCPVIVYRQPNDSGYFYPFGKGMDGPGPNPGSPDAEYGWVPSLGNFAANPLHMGNGFQAGNKVSAYDTLWYNSVTGFGDASIRCGLWDGDPFGIYDTSVNDPPLLIPGTQCTWTNLRQGGYDTNGCITNFCEGGYLNGTACVDDSDCGLCPAYADPWDEDNVCAPGCAGLYNLCCTLGSSVPMPNDEPWLVCEVLEGCRIGWRASWYWAPTVGKGGGAFGCAGVAGPCTDAVEVQYETGQFNYDGVGTCCDTGDPCNHTNMATGDDCSHPTFCSSSAVNMSDAWYYGAPTYYASFVATAYAVSNTYLSLVPTQVGADASTAVLVGDYEDCYDGDVVDCFNAANNELKMAAAGKHVWLHVEGSGWDPAELKTWQAIVDSAGYYTGCAGSLAPWNPACESDAECVTALGAGSWCDEDGDEGYPPTGCCPGFQDTDIIPNMLDIEAVATSDLDFAYGSTSLSGGLVDDGSTFYGGTLVLEVDSTAKGTFTIGFIPGSATFMKDAGGQPIPLIGLCPAKVTVEVGRCCYYIGEDCPSDDPTWPFCCIECCVTKADCDAKPGVTVFDPTKTCPPDGPDCPECTEDVHCDDGAECTVDTCESGTCVHVPIPGWSCYPDADCDRIQDDVDEAPSTPSGFVDNLTIPETHGGILDPGDQDLCVSDAPKVGATIYGVRAESFGTTGGGSNPKDAKLQLICTGETYDDKIRNVTEGNCITLTCREWEVAGELQTVAEVLNFCPHKAAATSEAGAASVAAAAAPGDITVELFAGGMLVATVELPETNSLSWDPLALEVTAPGSNNTTLTLMTPSGEQLPLPPGETVTLPAATIPAVSEWGLLALTLALLAGGKVYFGRRRRR